ncbi:MAG: MDR family MFS transporter [Pseudonocardia sp.]
MSTAPATAAPREALLTHRQILAILGGLMIGMFLAALDNTIVATSIRTIADDLRGLTMQAWATTAYLITATITTPLYGKLSDLFGRKPLFLTAISIFIVGSAACAFATSMYQLAAFRAIQGLGAGGLFSLALTIIGDIVAPRERARYQGYFVAVFGTASVLGPVVGGFFAGQAEIASITGWRWVFLINVPLGILALFVVTRVLNIPHTPRPARIDWRGALALAVALVPLLIVAEQGRIWGWGSPRSLLCNALGAAGIVGFLLAERRMGDDALLPLRFFRNNVFGWGTLAGFVTGMGMFGAIALLPLYLQIVQGASPTLAGLQTLPLMAGIMTMSIGSGQLISRSGRYKIWPIVGITLMTTGLVTLALWMDVDTPYWQTALMMLLVGLGLGGIMQPLTLAVQNAMPPRDMGVATASATFFRQMGGTLGTAVFLSLLFGALPGRISDGFRAAAGTPGLQAALADPAVAADPANAPILDVLRGGPPPSLDDSSFLGAADPRLARPILEAFAGSMSVVLLAAAAVLLVGLVAACLMRELPLRTQSGVEARRDPVEALDPAAVPAAVPEQAVPAARQAVSAPRPTPRPPSPAPRTP